MSVILWAQALLAGGHAFALPGNHALDLARGEHKNGSAWFFDERLQNN